MTEKFNYAEDVKKIAGKLIEEIDEFKNINLEYIDFVRTSRHISGDYVLAQCRLLDSLTQFLINKYYIIIIPPVFDTLDEETKKIVTEHEISHIPTDVEDFGNKIIKHDIGEFRKIINKYGLDYVNRVADAEEKIKKLKEIEKKKKQQEKLEKDKDEVV